MRCKNIFEVFLPLILCVQLHALASRGSLNHEGIGISMTENARRVVEENSDVLKKFITYLGDLGVQVQLVEVVTKELFGEAVKAEITIPDGASSLPQGLVSTAITDVANVGFFGDSIYDLEKVIGGAASLDFLVRYASKINPSVIPREAIPGPAVVHNALLLFNELKSAAVAG